MLSSLQTKNMTQHDKTRKRPAPIMVPAAAKKRRGLVSRTHSPKVVSFILHTADYLPRQSFVIVFHKCLIGFLHLISCCRFHFMMHFQVSLVSTPFLKKAALTTPIAVLNREIMCDVRKLSPTVEGVTEAARLICNGETVVVPTETVYMTCTSVVSLHASSKGSKNSGKSSSGFSLAQLEND